MRHHELVDIHNQVQHMLMRSAGKQALKAWRGYNAVQRHHAEVTVTIVKRVIRQQLLQSFYAWQEFTAQRRADHTAYNDILRQVGDGIQAHGATCVHQA